MKLNLASQDGIQILDIQGAVDSHSMQVLKAGITKLLRDGKNRIILQLDKNESNLPSEVLREVAILDVTAKELSGTIAIVCGNESMKANVVNFSKPPVISLFHDLPEALDSFRGVKKEQEGADPAVLQKALEAKEKEIEALKKQVSLLDPTEIQKLRTEKATLATQNGLLEEQLAAFVKQRRQPIDLDAYEQKIALLEDNIAKLSDQVAKAQK